jgi:hypothetical protein
MRHFQKKSTVNSTIGLLLLCVFFPAFPQIVITELQRNPAGGETASPGGRSHEFIEITNLGIDTVSLDSLCLTDGVGSDTVIPWPPPLPIHNDCITGSAVLLPGRTAVILDRDYPAAVDSVPSSRLPIRAGTVLLTVGDADLGNGLANDDGVLIYNGTKSLVRHIVCCAADSAVSLSDPRAGKITLSEPHNVPEGFSVVPVAFLFGSVRYGICADSLTPGSFELLKNNWFAEWRLGPLDTARHVFACTLACLKSGALPRDPVDWSMVIQSSSRTVTVAQGRCTSQGNKATAVFTLPLDTLSFFLHIREQDTETVWPFDVSLLWMPSSPVKINEIFPRGNAGEPEWFEVVNVSQMIINLKTWVFGNSEDSDTITISDCLLRPGDFLVFTANGPLFNQRYPAKNCVTVPPHWHALDNYNDTLCLWDGNHNLKERVCWHSDWLPGWNSQSLERVSFTNSGMDAGSWALASSPTPGQPNGAIFWRAGQEPRLDAGPLPFTPNHDGRDDNLSIIIELPAGYSAAVSIYGFSGKKLRSFSSPLSHQLFWDGRQDNGAPAPAGPFFVVMEATSTKGTTMVRKKGVLWR